jgi:biotin carboxylase
MARERFWVLGTEANRYHLHLSLTDKSVLIPSSKSEEPYLDALERLVKENDIQMIFPTHPAEVRVLAAHRERFETVRWLLPEAETITMADSKWATFERLTDEGVPTPKTFRIGSPDDLSNAFEKIGTRPVWVRGSGTPGAGIGLAALPCREVRHAEAWIDHYKGWGNFIASEYLPGKNLTWTGLFCRGDLVASQGRERLEYVLPHVSPSGITGAPAVSKTVSRADLKKTGETAVRAISKKPNGAFFVDFKEDAFEIPRVTEVNAGRFGTTIHFYTEAGFNFPYALVRLAFGDKVETVADPIPPETYWIRTLDCGPVLVRNLSNA